MKLFVLFIVIHYSIYLNCFFTTFDINLSCKNIYTHKTLNYILFYCKEKDGVDVYKLDLVTKKISIFDNIKGNEDNIYFVDFSGDLEILVKVSPQTIKITLHKIHHNSRQFIYAKRLTNRSSINEFTDRVFVDVNCDGYPDVVIPSLRYYTIYTLVRIQKRFSLKFLKRLYVGYVETMRKRAPYENMWFKISLVLPKISTYKHKNICFNLLYYSSVGIIEIYKNIFKRRVARIRAIKSKDKYDEFIVYPRPHPFIYCNTQCSLIHFASKKGTIYNTSLYYPYQHNEIQLVRGTLINFSHIANDIFWILYVPKMGFLGFYELLTKNTLEIKLGIVKNEKNSFSMLFEISLMVKINLKEEEGFITPQAGNFVCIMKANNRLLEIAFSEKDAIYKYIMKLAPNRNKIDITDKSKMDNPVKIFNKYECFSEKNAVILFTSSGKIKYLEKK